MLWHGKSWFVPAVDRHILKPDFWKDLEFWKYQEESEVASFEFQLRSWQSRRSILTKCIQFLLDNLKLKNIHKWLNVKLRYW
jgi:hypothetical protein